MKKQRLKVLKLHKKAISTLHTTRVNGQGTHSNAQQGTQEHCCYPL